jgi:hypothetical protein
MANTGSPLLVFGKTYGRCCGDTLNAWSQDGVLVEQWTLLPGGVRRLTQVGEPSANTTWSITGHFEGRQILRVEEPSLALAKESWRRTLVDMERALGLLNATRLLSQY